MVMPLIFLFQGRSTGSFGLALCGGYLGMVPLLGLTLLQYSQQWQAADLFRTTPLPGPSRISDGARRAVLCFLGLPALLLVGTLGLTLPNESSNILLLIPGLIAMPLFALYPTLGGKSVPLSLPIEEAKSAQSGLKMVGVIMVSTVLAAITVWAWTGDWFWWLVVGEAIVAIGVYVAMRAAQAKARWEPME
jgi:hypothetical protein